MQAAAVAISLKPGFLPISFGIQYGNRLQTIVRLCCKDISTEFGYLCLYVLLAVLREFFQSLFRHPGGDGGVFTSCIVFIDTAA